jgi:hypothetical protein
VGKGSSAWRAGRKTWEHLASWHAQRSTHADGESALDALDDIATLRRLLDQCELEAVRIARKSGRSWAEIATHLGVSRQSAWERWRDLDESTPASSSISEDESPRADIDELIESAATALVLENTRERRRRGTVRVPNVIGLSWKDARTKLGAAGLVATGSDPDGAPITMHGWPRGTVTDQSPESGAKVPPGAPVRLWLDEGEGGAGVREPRRPVPQPRVARALKYDEDSADLAG